MKSRLLLVLALAACLVSSFGCGAGEAPPPSDEKVKELNAKMDQDMKNMTLPANPEAKK